MTDPFDALNSDPEHTPAEAPRSKLVELDAKVDKLESKLDKNTELCQSAADNTFAILEAQRGQATVNEQFDRRLRMLELQRVVLPTVMALVAILFSGLALVR